MDLAGDSEVLIVIAREQNSTRRLLWAGPPAPFWICGLYLWGLSLEHVDLASAHWSPAGCVVHSMQ